MFVDAAEEASLRAAADPFAALLEHSRTAVGALEAKLSAALLSTDAVADQLDSQYRGLYDAKARLEAELRTSVAEVSAQREATAQANVALQQVWCCRGLRALSEDWVDDRLVESFSLFS